MKSILRGSLLTVAARWADRLIGLVSTLVLARLLVPEDFGIIAMASLAIALVDVIFDLGVHVTLIQNKAAQQTHFDTAWTLRLIESAVAALVLFVCAPYAVHYFNEPRVEAVIRALGLGLLLSAMENIGVVNFQKNMEFGRDFVFMFSKRFAGFAVTLLLAWLFRSYWAMVLGALFGRFVGVLLSYWMHPMRPRLSLACLREILGVSQWLLVRTAGGYLESQLHRLVVGGRNGAAVMGAYTMAGDISAMPSTELLMPINRVLFPAFVQVKDDLPELKRVFLLAFGVQSLLAIPASAGLALVAPELVGVMLGDKWLQTVPFMQVFAGAYLCSALLSSASYLLITLAHVRTLALFTWAQVAVFAVLVYGVFPGAGALQVAWLWLLTCVVCGGVFVGLLLRIFAPLRLADLVRCVLRPVLAAGMMALSLTALDTLWLTLALPMPLVLPLKVLAGALIYATTLFLAWYASARPDGPESYLLGKLRPACVQR